MDFPTFVTRFSYCAFAFIIVAHLIAYQFPQLLPGNWNDNVHSASAVDDAIPLEGEQASSQTFSFI